MPASLPTSLAQTGGNELSVYKGQLSTEAKIKGVATIKKAFPALPVDFYDVLLDRLEAAGFCDERLADAVSHVIDTCVYPQPTIAQFISFDKRVKLHSYHDYLKLVNDGDNGENYKPIKLRDHETLVWIHVNDIKKYNIKSEV